MDIKYIEYKCKVGELWYKKNKPAVVKKIIYVVYS